MHPFAIEDQLKVRAKFVTNHFHSICCRIRYRKTFIPIVTMKVAILGATGETGSSILDGLLESANPAFVSLSQQPPHTYAQCFFSSSSSLLHFSSANLTTRYNPN